MNIATEMLEYVLNFAETASEELQALGEAVGEWWSPPPRYLKVYVCGSDCEALQLPPGALAMHCPLRNERWEPFKLSRHAQACAIDIDCSDVLVALLTDPREPYACEFAEIGRALALKKIVIVVDGPRGMAQRNPYFYADGIQHVPSVAEAERRLASMASE